jgi:hypothetical protein
VGIGNICNRTAVEKDIYAGIYRPNSTIEAIYTSDARHHCACNCIYRLTFIILRSWLMAISKRYWANRIEFEGWRLVKALRSDMYEPGYCNATSKDFYKVCQDFEVRYVDVLPDAEVGSLALCPFNDGSSTDVAINPKRIYDTRRAILFQYTTINTICSKLESVCRVPSKAGLRYSIHSQH